MNGKESDNEVDGQGNTMTAEFWEYDPRIGRRWNTDPAEGEYSWQSPYAAFDNNPIALDDPDGMEAKGGPKHKKFNKRRYHKGTYRDKSKGGGFGKFAMNVGGFFRKVFTAAHESRMLIPQGTNTRHWEHVDEGDLASGGKSKPHNLFTPEYKLSDGTTGSILNNGGDKVLSVKLTTTREDIFGIDIAAVEGLGTDGNFKPLLFEINQPLQFSGDGLISLTTDAETSYIPFIDTYFLMKLATTMAPGWAAAGMASSLLNHGILGPRKKTQAEVMRVHNYVGTSELMHYKLDVKVRTWEKKINFGLGTERSKLWRILHSVK